MPVASLKLFRRNDKAIREEIAKLRALTPVGPNAPMTRYTIRLAIAVLKGTAMKDLNADELKVVANIRSWMDGKDNVGPSQGWGELVK